MLTHKSFTASVLSIIVWFGNLNFAEGYKLGRLVSVAGNLDFILYTSPWLSSLQYSLHCYLLSCLFVVWFYFNVCLQPQDNKFDWLIDYSKNQVDFTFMF